MWINLTILVITLFLTDCGKAVGSYRSSGTDGGDTCIDTNIPKEEKLWIDTVMYADGHSFGYSGDVSMWGGWYVDTIFVGDDQMLSYDSIGPATLKLSLVTRDILVDLGKQDTPEKIRDFMQPIDGFSRFRKRYEQCLDSVVDEEYGVIKYMGEFSFETDYPDSCNENAGKINQFICELTFNSESEKANVSSLSAFYAGFKQTKYYRRVYSGNTNDIDNLSDFLAHRTFENWWKSHGGLTPWSKKGLTPENNLFLPPEKSWPVGSFLFWRVT